MYWEQTWQNLVGNEQWGVQPIIGRKIQIVCVRAGMCVCACVRACQRNANFYLEISVNPVQLSLGMNFIK